MLTWDRPEIFLEGRPEQKEIRVCKSQQEELSWRKQDLNHDMKRGQGSATQRRKGILGKNESLTVEKRRWGGATSAQASTPLPLTELNGLCANLPHTPPDRLLPMGTFHLLLNPVKNISALQWENKKEYKADLSFCSYANSLSEVCRCSYCPKNILKVN